MTYKVLKFQDNDSIAYEKKDAKRTSLYIDWELHKKVQDSANKNRRSFNAELLCLVERSLEKQ